MGAICVVWISLCGGVVCKYCVYTGVYCEWRSAVVPAVGSRSVPQGLPCRCGSRPFDSTSIQVFLCVSLQAIVTEFDTSANAVDARFMSPCITPLICIYRIYRLLQSYLYHRYQASKLTLCGGCSWCVVLSSVTY